MEMTKSSAGRRSRSIPKWLVAIALVALLSAGGLAYGLRAAGQQPASPTYLTAPVTRGDVANQVSATGPIAPAASVPLSFKTSGKIAAISVQPGDRVKAGQILATEDPSDLQATLDGAKASLAQAQATLAGLEAGIGEAQRSVADAAVKTAQTAADDATANLGVTKESTDKEIALAEAGVTTAETNLAVAQAALVAAREQENKALAADQTTVDNAQKTLDAQKTAATANLKVLQGQLGKAKDDLWAAQTNRDGICGQGKGFACGAANASVGAAQTSVDTAMAQVEQGQKQGAQQVVTAQSQLDQARAQLASDKAHDDATISSVQGQIRQATDALTVARRTYDNARARAGVTVQTAQSQVDQSSSGLTSAQAGYRVAVATPSQASRDAARAQVDGARAAVEIAQANLDAATLRAPYDGTIASIDGAVGQWVSGGGSGGSSSSGLIQLVDLAHLTVVSQVNEADMAGIDVGNPVSFTLNAFPGQTFTGKVTAVQTQGTTSQNVVSYNVTSTIDPTSAKLLPGMTANVAIATNRRQNVLVVPVAALSAPQLPGTPSPDTTPAVPSQTRGSGTVLVLANGRATPRPVQVGLSDGHLVEIIAGVDVGDVVVTGIAQTNQPGPSGGG